MGAREACGVRQGRWSFPAARLARCLWPALLMGLPPVLSLPGMLDAEDEALAFSGARALVALGLIAGAVAAEGAACRLRRLLLPVGFAATGAYAITVLWALFGPRDVSMPLAIVLGLFVNAAAFLGAFSCAMLLADGRGAQGSTCISRWLVLGGLSFLAAGLVLVTAGLEPCWTVARLAFDPGGATSSGGWWAELPYDLAGIVGPGSHALRFGSASVGPGQLLVLAGWLALFALVAQTAAPSEALAGAGLGILLARALDEALRPGTDVLHILGAAFLLLGCAALATGRFYASRKAAPAKKGAETLAILNVLSPREREAVEGRLLGCVSSEVAEAMGISPSTVRNLQARAASKLGVASLDELSGAEEAGMAEAGKRRRPHEARLLPALVLLLCCLPVLAGTARSWRLVLVSGELIMAAALAWASGLHPKAGALRPGSLLTSVQLGLLCSLELGLYPGVESMAPIVARSLALADAAAMTFILWRRGDASAFLGPILIPLLLIPVDPWLALIIYSFGGLLTSLHLRTPAGLALAAMAFGLGMALGSSTSWPLFVSTGLLALRSNLPGLVSLSAAAGLLLGAMLLLGLAAILWLARDSLTEERAKRARVSTPSFDKRVLALCESRGLGETQAAIVLCIVRGMSGGEICGELSVSPGTVNAARTSAYRAFGVHSAASLTELVLRAVVNERGPSVLPRKALDTSQDRATIGAPASCGDRPVLDEDDLTA